MSWRRSFPKKGSGQKFGNTVDSSCPAGHSHRSKLEASVCALLHRRLNQGEFTQIECEVSVKICGSWSHNCKPKHKIVSIVDFKLTRPDGTVMWAEAKGMVDQRWSLKRRLWAHNELGLLEVWGGTAARPVLVEMIGI